MNKTAGIDFGTTNTTIGYSEKKGEAKLINIYNGSTTDRTSVFYSFEEGGLPIVGEEGFEEKLFGETGRLITSPKKFLKSDKLPDIQILREKYNLVDIISHIISHFKKKLEKEVGEEIDSILVGRPVRFHDTDDELNNKAENRLKEAFKKAGFKNIEFQYEPIAAFNAYANENEELKKSNSKILVVDLGGGTSDFSLFDVNEKGLDIIGNTGTYVGGDNLDVSLINSHFAKFLGKGSKQRLMNGGNTEIPTHVFYEFADKAKLLFFHEYESIINSLMPLLINKKDRISLGRFNDIFKNPAVGYLFHSYIEKTKIQLTDNEEVNINFDMFNDKFSTILNKSKFNEIIYNDIEKIRLALKEILNLSGLKAEDINKIIMNGGTSYIPFVQTMVEDTIGKGKILKGNTLSSVGYGLTLESYERFR